jgi:hypothetical protein
MRKLITIAIAVLAIIPTLALAGDSAGPSGRAFCGLWLPDVCTIDCVALEICCGECCEAGGSKDPITVEFLSADTTVLGTATIAGPWCDPCNYCANFTAPLDKSVNPCDVRYVRISKAGDDDLCMDCVKLNVGFAVGCKTKFKTAFDGCIGVTLGSGKGADSAVILH